MIHQQHFNALAWSPFSIRCHNSATIITVTKLLVSTHAIWSERFMRRRRSQPYFEYIFFAIFNIKQFTLFILWRMAIWQRENGVRQVFFIEVSLCATYWKDDFYLRLFYFVGTGVHSIFKLQNLIRQREKKTYKPAAVQSKMCFEKKNRTSNIIYCSTTTGKLVSRD